MSAYICRHGKVRSEHWCDDHDDHSRRTRVCGDCGEPLDVDSGYTGEAAYHRTCAAQVYGDNFHEDDLPGVEELHAMVYEAGLLEDF